jgi:integrase/recombinase XerD
MTIAEIREGFIAHLQSRRLSPATIRTYLDGIDRFGMAYPDVDLRTIGRSEIDTYVAALAKMKISLSTRETRLRGLRRLFEYLIDTQRLLVTPMAHLRQKYIAPKLGRVLSEAEAERLCNAPNTSIAIGVRDRALVELLYATGVRRGELCTLEVFDVDLPGKLLRVRHGKGGKERFVPLSWAAQKWLSEYLREIRPRYARRWGDRARTLFVTRGGKPINAGVVEQLLIKYSRKAHLKRVSCHALRRTAATALLRNGADILTVSEFLGHSQVHTTQRYTRLVIRDVRQAHARTHPRGDG